MSTCEHHTTPVLSGTWDVPAAGAARFSWEYDEDIGLWGPKVQHAYVDLGVIEAADSDLEVLMRADEELTEQIDNEK